MQEYGWIVLGGTPMERAPFIACIGEDADRTRAWIEDVRRVGMRARAFRSASAAIHHAASTRYDAVVTDWSIGHLDAGFLQQRLGVAMGSALPPVLVVRDDAEEIYDAHRFAAVLRRGCDSAMLVDAIVRSLGARSLGRARLA